MNRFRALFSDKSVAIMLGAVIAFTAYEAATHYVTHDKHVSPLLSTFLRLFFSLPLIAAYFYACNKSLPKPSYVFSIESIRAEESFFVRGVSWFLTILFINIAFSVSSNQSLTYVFFFLHPLWTALLAPRILLDGKSKEASHQFGFSLYGPPFVVMGLGVILFSVQLGEHTTIKLELSHAYSFMAGIAFSFSTLFGNRAQQRCPNISLCNGEKILTDSEGLNVLSIFIALPLTAVAYATAIITTLNAGASPIFLENDAAAAIPIIWLFVLIAAGSVIANILFLKAIVLARNVAVVSALDLLTLIFALPVDYIRGKIAIADLLGAKGVGIATILIGAAWMVISYERSTQE